MLFLPTTLSKQVSDKTVPVQFVNHGLIQFCQREFFLAFCAENAFLCDKHTVNGSHLFFDETITSFPYRVVDIRRFRRLGDISMTMT